MTDNELNTIKTNIALIQNDVKQIERVFQKVDHAIVQMVEIHKALAVQENILGNNEKRISILEDKLIRYSEDALAFRKELNNKLEEMRVNSQIERERKHKELLVCIENLNKNMSEKLDKQDKRISAIENWRWYILGIGAALLFILNRFPWAELFN